MSLEVIAPSDFMARPWALWAEQWFLLTCGDWNEGKFNTMTVAWGGIGQMWNRPFVQVVVRPSRHTYAFMETYASFTLSGFPEVWRPALQLLGSKSGRHGDKIAEAGLTPVAAQRVAAPAFAEAELVLECRKMYWDDVEPSHFGDDGIAKNYAARDYHRIYFGHILLIRGASRFRA